MLLSARSVPEHACPYTVALQARLSHDRFREDNGARQVRAFLIGRTGWSMQTFPGAFNNCLEQVYPCSSPVSSGLVLSLLYKEHLWTQSYYVGTAGAVSAETIKRYIAQCQGK
jgi:REP element-mobilizing transposase RayT